jgi:hypothetical protein
MFQHVVALVLQLILDKLGVAVWPNGDWRGVQQKMDVVVVAVW